MSYGLCLSYRREARHCGEIRLLVCKLPIRGQLLGCCELWHKDVTVQAGPALCWFKLWTDGVSPTLCDCCCREALPEEVMDRALRVHHITVRTVGRKYSAYESATEGNKFHMAFAPHA